MWKRNPIDVTALCLALSALGALEPFARAAGPIYERPPRAIQEVLDAPPPPVPIPGPSGGHLALAQPLYYPPLSDLAEPMLRLAGVRVNPRNNAEHGARYFVGLSLMKVPDGTAVPVDLPSGSRIGGLQWNARGTMLAFMRTTATDVELWVVEVATARARRVEGVSLNPILRSAVTWMPDQASLLVKAIPLKRSGPPEAPGVPLGPRIEESSEGAVASSTYESRDLLRTPHDADLFEHYATSQLALVSLPGGGARPSVRRIGPPAVYAGVEPSPSGKMLLVERIERPYSFLRAYQRFPTVVEVWDDAGKKLEEIANLPVAEQVPIHGVRTGPRSYEWMPGAPATLCWVEALDDGDTFKKVPHHDRIVLKPVGGDVRELHRLEQRFGGLSWLEKGGRVLCGEHDEDRHWWKTFLLDTKDPAVAPRLIWSLSTDERYANPGDPVLRMQPDGTWCVLEHEGAIFLGGAGSTPDGDRPFLDRMDLATLGTERLFRSDRDVLERFMTFVDPAAGTFLTSRQSPVDPPNVFLRTLGTHVDGEVAEGEPARTSALRPVTRFPDPAPQLRRMSKRLVTYERADGVKLSFTLYLPPDHTPGTRLPTVMWAYPLDYTDPATAGQVRGSPKEFTTIIGASPVFLALAGYAVLDGTAMPVVGPAETLYDTFIEQVTANARAAIDEAVELGVTDPDRVGVMGHSHGALMTANLLAWTDLFRAGVARSGAYNHTLRPFSFQRERRTLYQATETYLRLSPLLHADDIDEPLLLIHGELDANPGTVTMQSEKLFEAIRGVGGRTRLLVLPFESHGYIARESIEHVLHETVAWFDRHVKDAPPRTGAGGKSGEERKSLQEVGNVD